MQERIDWVDYAKGLGIILVVIGHVLRGINEADMGLNENFFIVSDFLIYSFHMPLFFFLSGVFVEKSVNKNFKTTILKKANSLLYPYFLWSIIQGTIMLILSSFTNREMTIGILGKIVYDPIDQFWFVYTLFFIFITYFTLRRKLIINQLLILSFILFFLSFYVDYWVLGSIFYYLIFLILGVYHNKIITKSDHYYLTIIILSLFVLLNYIQLSFDLKYPINALFIIATALSGILLTVKISKKIVGIRLFSFLNYFGEMSMVIYLAHILGASGFRIVLSKFIGVENIYIHIIGGTLAGLLCPLLLYYVARKIKIEKVLFGGFRFISFSFRNNTIDNEQKTIKQ